MPEKRFNQRERVARLRLIRGEGIGSATFWALIERFGSGVEALEALPGFARKGGRAKAVTPAAATLIEAELEAAAKAGVHIAMHGESAYPSALAAVEAPPPALCVRGDMLVLSRDFIAIVGARNASALGQRFARQLAQELGAAGLAIASGLARGIDTAAHKGSLETGTVAVMAGGVDAVYPPENNGLYRSILERGAAVSEMPMSFQPTAQHFPRRNRIISGLARGVVVVEATLHSGSLITARMAGEQGRDVFAVPGSPLDPRAKGTNGLLKQGAILTECADDVLSALGQVKTHIPEPAQAVAPAPAYSGEVSGVLKQEILQRLGPAPVEIDELVRLLGASAAEVAAAVLDLEFDGRLTRHAGHRISLPSGA